MSSAADNACVERMCDMCDMLIGLLCHELYVLTNNYRKRV